MGTEPKMEGQFLTDEEFNLVVAHCKNIIKEREDYNCGLSPDLYFPFHTLSYIHQINLKATRLVATGNHIIKQGQVDPKTWQDLKASLFDMLNYGIRFGAKLLREEVKVK